MKRATITFLLKNDKVLLANKKHSFGQGFLNGYGGKVKEGETPEVAAAREVTEESGVLVSNLDKVAIIDFYDTTNQVFECHVFFATEWIGEPMESDEMEKPELFEISNLPFERMWKADKEWLPLVFAGKKIHGKAFYKDGMKEMDYFEYTDL